MIRAGDRVAVGFSGGKDSFTLIEALVALRERAPIDFTIRAFTIDQGKFLSPIEPWGNSCGRAAWIGPTAWTSRRCG